MGLTSKPVMRGILGRYLRQYRSTAREDAKDNKDKRPTDAQFLAIHAHYAILAARAAGRDRTRRTLGQEIGQTRIREQCSNVGLWWLADFYRLDPRYLITMKHEREQERQKYEERKFQREERT